MLSALHFRLCRLYLQTRQWTQVRTPATQYPQAQVVHALQKRELREGHARQALYAQRSGSYLSGRSADLPQAVENHTCRAGHYCPSSGVILPCPPGSFCPKGSIGHTTCDYQRLIDQAPDTIIPAQPFTVYDRVHDAGDPLGGNICPFNSSTPLQPCKKGFYCPDATTILPCPEGKFCKWWSRRPKSCPWLATCPHGSTSADLSLAGFFFMLLILLLLWLAYVACDAYIRLQQGVVIQKQQAKEKLHKLVAPLLTMHNAHQLSLQALGAIQPKLNLSFSEVGATLRDGTIILQGVTGHFNNAKVAAVMGPSGAGKTTFLNALMGTVKYGTISGQVWVNGRAMNMSRLRRIMGFVPQDDIVHEDLTVRENLEYSAWLRNPKYMRTRAKGDLVDDVIDVLNLRSVQHSVVGTAEKRGISGGQRKRVNIGLELVSKPSLLFMDEPTSGLDATAATDILTALKRMADLGMTIVTVVHQPRYGIFVLFDEVLLLGKAGRTVFQGPSTAALPYFNSLGFELPPNENPADFCLDVISGSIPCQGHPGFRPEDLYPAWIQQGLEWIAVNGQQAADTNQAHAVPAAPLPQDLVLSPEQLQLVTDYFQKVDQSGRGVLTPADINGFLNELGLEPTSSDVLHIIDELDWSGSGIVSRYDFIEFIRNGGRRPYAHPDPLTRQGSIELVSEASDAGQTEQKPPPPTHIHPGADPLQPHDNAEGMTRDHMEAALGFRPSDGQQQHQLGLQTKLAPLQTAAGGTQDDLLQGVSPSSTIRDLEAACGPLSAASGLLETTSLPPASDAAILPLLWARLVSNLLQFQRGVWGACRWPWGRKKRRFRTIPGVTKQFKLLLRRAGVKWVRGWSYKFIDMLLFVGAALVVGVVHGTSWELEKVRGNGVMAMLTLAIISVVAALQVFGKDRLIFWRESESGLHTSAFFFGHAAMHMIDILVQPAIFMSLYYTLTLPEIKFVDYYIVAVLVTWYTSGLGYLMSVVMAPQNSMVAAVAVCMIVGGFLNGVEPRYRSLSSVMKHVFGLSYARWSTEAISAREFSQYEYYMQPRIHTIMSQIGYCGLDGEPEHGAMPGAPVNGPGSLDINIYCKGYVARDYTAMFIQGLVLRLLTYLGLKYCNQRSKHNPVARAFTHMWMRVRFYSKLHWWSMPSSPRSASSLPVQELSHALDHQQQKDLPAKSDIATPLLAQAVPF
ncbi:hypothetical protein WJX77_000240 [Trebouxia sp. C0004]